MFAWLKSLFAGRPKVFVPTNAIETMIKEKIYETDTPRFFEFFSHRQVFMVIAGGTKNGKLKLITSAELKGHKFAYVFTSQEAMQFSLRKSKIESRQVAQVSGRAVMETVIAADLGIFLNSGHEELVLVPPDKIKLVLEQLDRGPQDRKVDADPNLAPN